MQTKTSDFSAYEEIFTNLADMLLRMINERMINEQRSDNGLGFVGAITHLFSVFLQ